MVMSKPEIEEQTVNIELTKSEYEMLTKILYIENLILWLNPRDQKNIW